MQLLKLKTSYDDPISGISSTMDVTKKAELNIDIDYKKTFVGKLNNLWVYFTNATSSPTAITMRLTSDANGDDFVVTNTTSAMDFGLTTTSQGCAIWALDLNYISNIEKLYLFCNTDTGTLTISKVELTYEVLR